MEVEVGLVSQIRNEIGIAAGLLRIGVPRKERLIDCALQHLVRIRIRPLHLVVDDTVSDELRILALQLVSPAFLAENLLLLVEKGVKDRIQIDIHQVLKVLRVAARNRIDRAVRVGHRIQEGIQRALHKLHERILGPVLLRAAEHGVLDNVCDAGRVLRRRPKADRKDLVRIVREQEKNAGAGLLVLQLHAVRLKFFETALRPDAIGVQLCDLRQLFLSIPLRCHIISSPDSVVCSVFRNTYPLRARCSRAPDSA